MRQLVVFVPAGKGPQVLEAARACGGTNLACLDAVDAERSLQLVLVHAENDKIDPLVARLQQLGELQLTLLPRGVIALRPPADQAPEQVTDVSSRSPLEVFLGGMQSVGSWAGFLGYAAVAAVVVWIGLHTNTIYLLTASMLIAPFAGPAMTLAMGTARGDRTLIARSLVRYFSALALTVVVAALLSVVFQQDIATELMVRTSLVSAFTVLLPLTAGAAGALNLCQSERNSLVTAAGPGVLVAASLAPPAGMIGMASAIGEWEMVTTGLFVLLLQLVGINVSGAVVFAVFGLSPQGVRYQRGRAWMRWVSLGVAATMLGALLWWQLREDPGLEQSTRTQRIAYVVRQAVEESGQVHPVEVNVRFTRADIEGQNTVLVSVYAQPREAVERASAELERELKQRIRERVRAEGFNVTPLVEVTVLSPTG